MKQASLPPATPCCACLRRRPGFANFLKTADNLFVGSRSCGKYVGALAAEPAAVSPSQLTRFVLEDSQMLSSTVR